MTGTQGPCQSGQAMYVVIKDANREQARSHRGNAL